MIDDRELKELEERCHSLFEVLCLDFLVKLKKVANSSSRVPPQVRT
jgi:hypothetical protein